MRIESLEKLASEMVGDGHKPNVFFVTKGKQGIVMITRDVDAAYQCWSKLASSSPRVESTLEDRKNGVVCSVEQWEKEWLVHDDAKRFGLI